MSGMPMHVDEIETDASLVRRLLTAQFPRWAHLPIEAVSSAGTDNALYRLGEDMVVRLPRLHGATRQIEKEDRWLRKLALRVPLSVPLPLATGMPGEGYPWPWSVNRWLEGRSADVEPIADPVGAARDLAGFVTTLAATDPRGAPRSERDEALTERDGEVRSAIEALRGEVDPGAAAAAWTSAVEAPPWDEASVWIHGDLLPGNLLIYGGRLTAVIDYGCCGLGDPAVDVMPAWFVFGAEGREAFRAELDVDDATWMRGRGWALSVGLIALPYYRETNAVFAGVARRAIAEVLADPY
jgi:aminoglycoside phosphotransferase (APT) family kinase protein